MPTCPGCRRQMDHGDLGVHERYCPHIWVERAEVADHATRWNHLARSLQDLDRRFGGE